MRHGLGLVVISSGGRLAPTPGSPGVQGFAEGRGRSPSPCTPGGSGIALRVPPEEMTTTPATPHLRGWPGCRAGSPAGGRGGSAPEVRLRRTHKDPVHSRSPSWLAQRLRSLGAGSRRSEESQPASCTGGAAPGPPALAPRSGQDRCGWLPGPSSRRSGCLSPTTNLPPSKGKPRIARSLTRPLDGGRFVVYPGSPERREEGPSRSRSGGAPIASVSRCCESASFGTRIR